MPRGSVPSIRMVAARAGVSIATVSNVVNGKASVAVDVAERVRAAIRELGYVRDVNAARLRAKKATLAAVVVPDLANPMFAAFVSVLEHEARGDGFDLAVLSSRNDPAEEAHRLASLRAWRPAGLIVIPCDGALVGRLPADHALPTVVADRLPDEGRFDLVAVDNGPVCAAMAGHLREAGARSCLVIGSSLRIANIAERWDGFQGAAGPLTAEMLEVGFDADSVTRRLRPRLSERRPDALFALDHPSSLASFQLIGAMGLAIPRDIAFASFDEMDWMRLVTPPLTAVLQPVEAMAKAAWARLRARLDGDESPTGAIRLPCTLTPRASTRIPSGAIPR
ncbi:LacI family DNA-binding transcriptional regulator [Aureimonas ureilytica]|uniref:LacI family DNA-binding transcriptional regulator n=1 Tax=Aureimonas ureilytica TaxID=401562 RepID=UPI000477A4D9|nr:LacI family DNA-binding transcriptional regulator [Aureimonas ureilytica]